MSAEEIELVTGGALTEEEQAEIDQIESDKTGLPTGGGEGTSYTGNVSTRNWGFSIE